MHTSGISTDTSSLNILLVLEASGGGAGQHVLDLAKELIHLGHRVQLIYSGLRIEPHFSKYMSSIANLTTTRMDFRRAPHPDDFVMTWKVRRFIQSQGPFDIVHGHSSKAGAIVRLAARGLPAVAVYTPHAFRTMDRTLSAVSGFIYTTIERLLGKMGEAIILVGQQEQQHAIALGLPEDKLHVVLNGIKPYVDIDSRRLRKEFGFRPEQTIIGFVGRLVEQKAPHRVLEGYAKIASRYPDSRLIMLGDGHLAVELAELACSLGIDEQVHWVQDVDGAYIMPLFNIFVMPSLYEAFPYVLLEAVHCGLPIVATGVGGTHELLHEGKNGYLVPHDDALVLGDRLARLLDDPVLRVQMGKESKKIGQDCTIVTMTQAVLEVYNYAIKRKAS